MIASNRKNRNLHILPHTLKPGMNTAISIPIANIEYTIITDHSVVLSLRSGRLALKKKVTPFFIFCIILLNEKFFSLD